MFKLRVALYSALVVGILTLIVSFLHGVRPLTMLYRTIISSIIFGAGGYIVGGIAEVFLQKLLAKIKDEGQNVDTTTDGELTDSVHSEPQFNPLTFDNLERVVRPKE